MVDLKEPELEVLREEDPLDDQEILKKLRSLRIINIWAVRVFFAVLFCVAIIALVIPLRPDFSETEKRELEKFPKFKVSTLLKGEYFTGIDNWYSDTFPQRDFFSQFNAVVNSFFGFSEIKIYGEIEEGDVIPSVENVTTSEETGSSETESLEEPVVSEDSQITESNVSSEVSTPPVSSSPPPQNTPSSAPSTPAQPPAPITQSMGAIFINGDSAYEYYNFHKSSANKYSVALNRAAELLAGHSTVYNIVVPTSMGITAPDDLVKNLNTSNQKNAINYINSLLSPSVVKVPIYDKLKEKKDEYIYFRTDHHWTALGAYYAYAEWSAVKGVAPKGIETFKTYQFPGFLGTFYTSSKKLPQLAANPDTVFAYEPAETNAISICNMKGNWYNSKIISDMSSGHSSSKYLTFIKGDNPISYIVNPNLTDGSACLVVKESFGNAFVPFLVSHYQTVYVLDYRYFANVDSRGIVQYCQEQKINDVIFINNISATRNPDLMKKIDSFVR